MNKELMFSSKTDLWSTPQDFFDKLNEEFNFTLDPCATDENHKCNHYFTEKDNGLKQSWMFETVFCNPPYSEPEFPCKKNCKKKICKNRGYCNDKYVPGQIDWVKKCALEFHSNDTPIVMLIPARTDTTYFHDYIYNKPNVEIRFIRGRLKFGNSKNSAPFPSMVVIFR